jgi:drug/metabolite transporter (DMT)-like permease
MIITVVFALASAFSTAVNLLTQHSASIGAPQRERGWRLARYLLRHPLWLLGWIAAVCAFAFQAIALHYGELSVVQPILVTELVFVLMLRYVWIHQMVAHAAWTAALITCAALAIFLTAAEPHGGHPTPGVGAWLSALLVFGGIVVALTVLAMRGSSVRRAALYATAAAVTWALLATFTKAATDALTMHGIGGMLTRWPVYGLIVSGIAGTLLQQAALHVGPLSVSQPLLVVVNPLVSIILSVWLFDEHFTHSPVRIVVAVLAFAVMAVGVTRLTRTAPADLARSRPQRA